MAYAQSRYANSTLMVTFETPLFLLFSLCIAPACAVTVYRIGVLKKQYATAHGVQSTVRILKVRTLFWALSWLFLCISIAVPLWGTKQTTILKHGNAVVFAVDISRSMTVADIAPSRIEFAKHYVTFLIEGLPDAACGLVTVKGQGTLAVPLSFNRQSIITAIETLSPFSATSIGSNLAHGLDIAAASFPENRLMRKTIVLCTDGGETIGSIAHTIPHLRKNNIQLIIIGFGTQKGGTVSILNEQHESVLQKCVLDEAPLKQCAQQISNGSFYISATDIGSASMVLQSLKSGKTKSGKIHYMQKPVRRTFECTAIALFFFVIGLWGGGYRVKNI